MAWKGTCCSRGKGLPRVEVSCSPLHPRQAQAFQLSWLVLHSLLTVAACVLLLAVLLRFRTEKGRDPSPCSSAEDAEALLQLRSDVLGSLGVETDLLPDDFAR